MTMDNPGPLRGLRPPLRFWASFFHGLGSDQLRGWSPDSSGPASFQALRPCLSSKRLASAPARGFNLQLLHGRLRVRLDSDSRQATALNLLCESEDKSYIERTGSAHGWDVLFYIFSFLKDISLFTLIISFDDFGFTHNGMVELNVSEISLSDSSTTELDLHQLGFFLTAHDTWIHVVHQLRPAVTSRQGRLLL